jgi:hypothetical protein
MYIAAGLRHPARVVFALAFLFASIAAAESPSASRLRALNAEVLELHAAMHGAPYGGSPEDHGRIPLLLGRRASQLSTLMQEDPASAIDLAFSPELLTELSVDFPEAASQLELLGSWEGKLEHWVMDFPNGTAQSQILLHGADSTLELHLTTGKSRHTRNGEKVWVTGILLGRIIAAEETTPAMARRPFQGTKIQTAMDSNIKVFSPQS